MYLTQLILKMKSTVLAKYFNMVPWILDRQMIDTEMIDI